MGPSALARIEAWAVDHGWVPTDADDLLGTWDGVSFTVGEADAVLALCNVATVDELDVDIALDVRAVDSIIDARPIDPVFDLSGLYYVGTSALNRLKDAAASEAAVVDDPVVIDFEDQFNHDEEIDIPDGDEAGVDLLVHVVGVPDIEVELTLVGDFLHDAPEELVVDLIAPDGEVYELSDGSSVLNEVLDYAGDPNGYWTLSVADMVPGNFGTVYGWAIEVRSVH